MWTTFQQLYEVSESITKKLRFCCSVYRGNLEEDAAASSSDLYSLAWGGLILSSGTMHSQVQNSQAEVQQQTFPLYEDAITALLEIGRVTWFPLENSHLPCIVEDIQKQGKFISSCIPPCIIC